MEFVNGNRLVAVREGRVMEGKIRMEGSAEIFTLVLSRKEVIFPTIMGEDAYGKIDPAHADDEEYGRARYYKDTEDNVYKGDRGNILCFSSVSVCCTDPGLDPQEPMKYVAGGTLAAELKEASRRIVWVRDVVGFTHDHVIIEDEKLYSEVSSVSSEDIPWYIQRYVEEVCEEQPIGFGAGRIRDGVFERL